jgi:hypothetical protein
MGRKKKLKNNFKNFDKIQCKHNILKLWTQQKQFYDGSIQSLRPTLKKNEDLN